MLNKKLFFVPLIVAVLISACTSRIGQNPTAIPTADKIEGLFDIGGMKLYMSCAGTGSPTIVYLHGDIKDEAFSGASSALSIQAMLSDRYRFCVYDRRNVGKSDEVPGTYTGPEAAADLHALLAAAGIEPPYVLLGASFGGLLADLYAATYPDEVIGMVLLDSMFPTDLELESLLPEDMRYKHEDDCCNNERLSHLSTLEAAYELPQPSIPVTYLLAMPFGWYLDVPEYDAVVRDTIEDYVAGFSPGLLIEVQSPHYMEQSVPNKIVEELEKLIQGIAR